MRKLMKLTAVAAFTLSALPALAVPFSATPADVLGPLNGGSVLHNVSSPGASAVGGATLTFDLLGYGSVDGSNCCTDTFTLTVNGTMLFQGGFGMGGGGADFTIFIASGVSANHSAASLVEFTVAHTVLSGNNTYLFDYGVMQGLSDEGWGLRDVVINADVNIVTPTPSTAVPEPFTLSLLGAGLAGIGLMRRRRGA